MKKEVLTTVIADLGRRRDAMELGFEEEFVEHIHTAFYVEDEDPIEDELLALQVGKMLLAFLQNDELFTSNLQ